MSARVSVIADLPVEYQETDPLLARPVQSIQDAPDYSDPPEEVFREVLFVSLPFFSGCAALNSLQYEVKETLGIRDGSSEIFVFQAAVSMMAIGTFLFRLGQNLFLVSFLPRSRVMIAQAGMAIALGIICLVLFHLKESTPIALVFISYLLAGCSTGIFESNLLCSVGSQNKFWAILGMPIGFNGIAIGGFLMLAQGVFCGWLFLVSLFGTLASMLIFSIRLFPAASGATSITVKDLWGQVKQFKRWMPKIAAHSGALAVTRFISTLFNPGVLLYIYADTYVNFNLTHRSFLKYYFFAIYITTFFIGDTLGRKLAYNRKIIFPFLFLLFPLVGSTMALLPWAEIAIFAGFFVQIGNGCIYAQSSRQIETKVDKRYSLVAFSMWLFLGDIGGIIGSSCIQVVNLERKEILSRFFGM